MLPFPGGKQLDFTFLWWASKNIMDAIPAWQTTGFHMLCYKRPRFIMKTKMLVLQQGFPFPAEKSFTSSCTDIKKKEPCNGFRFTNLCKKFISPTTRCTTSISAGRLDTGMASETSTICASCVAIFTKLTDAKSASMMFVVSETPWNIIFSRTTSTTGGHASKN